MPVHPIDFQINPNVFSTPELTAIFEEKAVFQRWLDFEAALASIQGEMGIIPKEAGDEISKTARLELLDLAAIREGYGKSRNSVVPLLGGLRKACSKKYGEFVHYGATTQDVLDTGEILSLRQSNQVIYRDLRGLEEICLDLAKRHRSTPMAARTHGQQALPTTFGLKVSIWLGEIRRHIERLKSMHTTLCQGQLGGAVGTMAALGPQAMEVSARTMKKLGLGHDPASWHTSRDRVTELSSVLSMIVMTCAKIANEIFQLQKTEIGELVEPPPSGALASSTMPHKRNPVLCQRIIALSKHVRALSGTVMESMLHEHERDPRSLWAEWLAIPQLCIYTGTVIHYLNNVLSGLFVNSERMQENLYRQKEMITTEWLLFQLSESIGKMRSIEKLHELTGEAAEKKVALVDLLLNDEEIGSFFNRDKLSMLDHPERYTGHAEAIVGQVLSHIEDARKADPEKLAVS